MDHPLQTNVAPLPPGADPAGARHLLVRRHQSGLSFSAFGAPLEGGVAPGRAFCAQGLWLWLGWDAWKYVDAFAFGLRGPGGQAVTLSMDGARATPWEMEFSFAGPSARLRTAFYLVNLRRAGAAGCVTIDVDAPADHRLAVGPLLDVAPLRGETTGEYWCREERGALLAGRGNATVCLGMPENEVALRPREVKWEYPLGLGELRRSGGGAVAVPVARRLYAPGELIAAATSCTMLFSAAPSTPDALELLRMAATAPDDRRREEERVDIAAARLEMDRLPGATRAAVVARAVAMLKFGVLTPRGFFHDTADFWDRRLRPGDALEGLYHNVGAYHRLGLAPRLAELLLGVVRLRDGAGRLPSGFDAAGKPSYSGVWGTLFAPCVAARLLCVGWPDGLKAGLLDMVQDVLDAPRPSGGGDAAGPAPDAGEDAPWVGEDGLLRCAPHHGWADGRRHVGERLLPQRIPLEWEEDMAASGDAYLARQPRYLLCEVNALWLAALDDAARLAERAGDRAAAGRLGGALERARRAYRDAFWDGEAGGLRHAVADFPDGRQEDGSPTAYAVQAAALAAGERVLSDTELAGVLRMAERHLLVRRGGLAFGLRVTAGGQGLYLNPDQSHQGVCLPRLTPYVLSLAHRLDRPDLVEELLQSNLDHQMREGCLFYNHEVLSTEGAIRPAGNPAGWCSQWVDPYLAYETDFKEADDEVMR